MNRPNLLRGTLLAALFLATGLVLPGFTQAALTETGSWGKHIERPDFQVRAVVYDSQGRAFVAETGMSRIVRMNTEGELDFNWTVGPRPKTRQLRNPVDLAIDGSDHIYALDQIDSKVRKYATDGTLLGEWQVQISNGKVQGITFESGSVWVISDNKVRRYSPTGTLEDSWAGFDTYQDWIEPQIRGDGTGHLIVTGGRWTDSFKANKTLYRFDLDGNPVSAWTSEAQGWVDYVYDGYDDYEELADIDGFDAVAPVGASDPWTSAGSKITRYNSSGEVGDWVDFDRKRFPNSLAFDGDGNLLYSWDSGDHNYKKSSGLALIDPQLDPVRDWSEFDFPKYADLKWEGYFGGTDGLTARSDGSVGIYDYALRRVQFFDSEGNFLHMIDAPRPEPESREPLVLLPDSGGAEFYAWETGELVRMDENGDLIDTITLDLPERVTDISLLPDGGYAAVSARHKQNGLVTILDQQGEVESSFELTASGLPRISELVAIEPLGTSLLVLDRASVTKYSRSGKRQASWVIPRVRCDRGNSLDGLALDFRGNVYIAVAGFEFAKLIRLDSDLVREWEEPVPGLRRHQSVSDDLDVGPGGIYLGLYQKGIHRYDQSKAKARPKYEKCPKPFRLVRVVATSKKKWAIAVVHSNSAGLITVSGRKVRTVKRPIQDSGDYGLAIRPKKKFARRGSGRLVKFPVTITYEGKETSRIRTVVRLRTG